MEPSSTSCVLGPAQAALRTAVSLDTTDEPCAFSLVETVVLSHRDVVGVRDEHD
jgi:hypothetical protein